MIKKNLLTLALTLTMTSPAFAAKKKVCNDLKATQCKKRQDCTWVKKSKKSDRKAYCRSKGKKAKAAKK